MYNFNDGSLVYNLTSNSHYYEIYDVAYITGNLFATAAETIII